MTSPDSAESLFDVAALYIDPRGPYPSISGVDCWDEKRDARKYDGPWPVVAHPPCGPYGKLRHLYEGAEHDCAARAVEQVRTFGGVLEHPAGSKLWGNAFEHGEELPPPEFVKHWPWGDEATRFTWRDHFGGITLELEQVEFGHVARKKTWLYIVGVDRSRLEPPPFPGREPTHWLSGFREHSRTKQTGAAVPPGIKVCSAQQRRRTPPLFAEYLVRLARSAAKVRAA